jgi:uncharacterized protein
VGTSNRLADATSPYLLQHAHNPVDWFPWGDEAFARARSRDLPIFLSVGYAACHWCHVMERESFEDAETAAFMNDRFVSIKVDREERPDVDTIYMDAVQAMTGSGGWPMSIFLTPAGRPFYAGTYFPDTARHGMPSFRQVLEAIAEAWSQRRAEVEAQGAEIADAIARVAASTPPDTVPAIDDALTHRAFAALSSSFDHTWGGFGPAPKFPQPMVLTWLLRQHLRGKSGALEMTTRTLDRMASGGIHDQVGGGFARYSTDARWHVPHFEKMLTDNALLLELYTRAWLVTRSERYRTVALRTADYLLETLQRPEGGFASSQDADTGGVEGQTYVWDRSELLQMVADPVADAFGARPEGNWEGTNVLWLPDTLDTVAARHRVDPSTLAQAIDDGRKVLLERRRQRAQPAIDDKVVAAWNGLAIGALAIAGRAFKIQRYLDAATASATFVWSSMRDAEGRLARSWRGTSSGPGFLDDHALLALGLLTLFETTGDHRWFDHARSLIEVIGRLFVDPTGGFHLTGADADTLITRPKDLLDTATPSGTSAAADALVRFARYVGDPSAEDTARAALAPALAGAGTHPSAFGHALCVADMLIGPAMEIAIVGDPDTDETEALSDVIFRERYLPNAVAALSSGKDASTDEVPLLVGRTQVGGAPTAYVCERFVCRAPTTDANVLAELVAS